MRDEFLSEAIRLSLEAVRNGIGGPFGAVIVKDDEIIGGGCNQVTSTNDPTAHAEIVAIREACQRLGSFHLKGCELYSSCEPCPMCLAAIYWAKIDKVYYALTGRHAAEIGFADDYIAKELSLPISQRQLPMMQIVRPEALMAFKVWAIQEYDQTGKITVTKWDTTQKKIISPTGVIPITSDWQQALQIDFLDYTGDPKSATTDPTKWVFLKSTADGQQMLYAQPLTAEQLNKLRLAVGVEEKQNTLPEAFRLMQNYPNPFNPATTIEFHLPSPTVVTLKIYNLMGFEMKTLLSNEKLDAGVYKFSVGIDELRSGVYFYQLVTPAFSQTRKMTVLR